MGPELRLEAGLALIYAYLLKRAAQVGLWFSTIPSNMRSPASDCGKKGRSGRLLWKSDILSRFTAV